MQFRRSKSIVRLGIILLVISSLAFVFVHYKRQLLFKPYRQYRASQAQTERLEISLSEPNAQFLDSLRLDALKTGKITPEHKIYVDGDLLYDNEILKIHIRLKGDQLDHYHRNPPSYRIKVLDDNIVLGCNKFSIHSFGNRNFLSEWFYHKLLEQRDVLSLHMDVIEMRVNNMESICTFEEHFTHFLTDRFKRPNGPIICISEELFWSDETANDSLTSRSEMAIYANSPIKEFKSYTELDSNHVQKAMLMLDQFRKNILPAHEVFDIQRLAIHYAISDLTNTHHALRWHNNRFYYNPTTDRLEPIGFDGSSWEPLSVFAFDDDFLPAINWSELASDQTFVKAYLLELEQVSREAYLDSFFSQYDDALYDLANKIYKKNCADSTEVFWNDLVFSNNYKGLYDNAAWIRNNLPEYRTRLLGD